MMFSPDPHVATASGLLLEGTSEFSVQAGRVLLRVDAIRSLRDIDNLSGSLAVELWAMLQPLNGAEPEAGTGAQRLAATTIGEIRGQHFVPDCRYDLLFDPPSPGSWQIALLLREWNGHGYSTCDAVNFPVLYQVTGQPETVAERLAGKPVAPTAAKVPVNSATVNEIAALRGLTPKVAKAIVAGRPYVQFNDLLKVKGVGERLVRALRPLIRLD